MDKHIILWQMYKEVTTNLSVMANIMPIDPSMGTSVISNTTKIQLTSRYQDMPLCTAQTTWTYWHLDRPTEVSTPQELSLLNQETVKQSLTYQSPLQPPTSDPDNPQEEERGRTNKKCKIKLPSRYNEYIEDMPLSKRGKDFKIFFS